VVGWIAALFFPGMFLVLAVNQKGYVALAALVLFFLVAVAFAARFVQEYRIISSPTIASAVVKALRQKPLEAGHVYSIKYRFTAEDGKDYIGSSGWSAEKLGEGERITVLYRQKEPWRNFPIRDFRFYNIDLI
jgi:hypothetical protein